MKSNLTAAEAIALYRSELAASIERNQLAREKHFARIAEIVTAVDKSTAVVGANGRRRARGVSVPRSDPKDLLRKSR